MAIVLETAVKNALADQIDTLVNVGAGTANLIFETSADAAVATIPLQNPAFDAAAAGVIALAGTPISDTNAVGGTVAQFSIFDRNALKILEGVVQVSGADMDLSSLAVGATDTVQLTSFSITVP